MIGFVYVYCLVMQNLSAFCLFYDTLAIYIII